MFIYPFGHNIERRETGCAKVWERIFMAEVIQKPLVNPQQSKGQQSGFPKFDLLKKCMEPHSKVINEKEILNLISIILDTTPENKKAVDYATSRMESKISGMEQAYKEKAGTDIGPAIRDAIDFLNVLYTGTLKYVDKLRFFEAYSNEQLAGIESKWEATKKAIDEKWESKKKIPDFLEKIVAKYIAPGLIVTTDFTAVVTDLWGKIKSWVISILPPEDTVSKIATGVLDLIGAGGSVFGILKIYKWLTNMAVNMRGQMDNSKIDEKSKAESSKLEEKRQLEIKIEQGRDSAFDEIVKEAHDSTQPTA